MGEFGRDWESFGRVLGKFWRVLETLGDFGRLWEKFDGSPPPGVGPVAQFESTGENFRRDWESLGEFWASLGEFGRVKENFGRVLGEFGRVLETLEEF